MTDAMQNDGSLGWEMKPRITTAFCAFLLLSRLQCECLNPKFPSLFLSTDDLFRSRFLLLTSSDRLVASPYLINLMVYILIQAYTDFQIDALFVASTCLEPYTILLQLAEKIYLAILNTRQRKKSLWRAVGWDSVVGVATCYGLDDLGIGRMALSAIIQVLCRL